MTAADKLTDEELLALDHNNHEGAFQGYLNGSRHSDDKKAFLRKWIAPTAGDKILECGSSSGKTSIDFARNSSCYCLGVDFDPEAVQISNAMRETHFPELGDRCEFECNDLTSMTFNTHFNKVLMPDFSEHIPDRVFAEILQNLKSQLPNSTLYIYTPNRSHIFEILKHRNILLRNSPGHINVKTRKQVEKFLQVHGWKIKQSAWRRSSIPVFNYLETIAGHIPLVGSLFQRRVVVKAQCN